MEEPATQDRRSTWAGANGDSAAIVRKSVLWAAGTLFTGYIAATLIVGSYFFGRLATHDVEIETNFRLIKENSLDIVHNNELISARNQRMEDKIATIRDIVQGNTAQVQALAANIHSLQLTLTRFIAASEHNKMGGTPEP